MNIKGINATLYSVVSQLQLSNVVHHDANRADYEHA